MMAKENAATPSRREAAVSEEQSPGWFRLDNAAKVYPAIKTYKWSTLFRISVLLTDTVDPELLEQALIKTIKRFPSLKVRMRRGFFWYYLEHNRAEAPPVLPDIQNPCQRIKWHENRRFLFRVYYYDRRIACDFFHSLADGYGGMVFINTLLSVYLNLRNGIVINAGSSPYLLDTDGAPDPEEIEDAFARHADSKARISLTPPKSYRIGGVHTGDYRFNITTGIMPTDKLLALSRSAGASITEYLAALMTDVHYHKQLRENKRQRPVTVQIPVDVRKYFPTKSLRNFSLYLNADIDPNLGVFTFDEILRRISLQTKLYLDPKQLNAHMSTNMMFERNPLIRAFPLIIKNLGINLVYQFAGHRNTTAVSNIGRVDLPEYMKPFVERYDVMLGPSPRNGVICALVSYDNKMAVTLTGTIEDNDVEREFFTRLVKLGVPVKVESNRIM